MAELRDIQLVELEMLKYLNEICKTNNLRYMMVGGTMLGAIRHLGFIPWDDDVDVYMPYSDYCKLKEVTIDKRYFLQTPVSDIETPHIMAKLRKNGTLMRQPGKEKLQMHQGIWIDIFPYFDSASNPTVLKLQLFLRQVLMTYRCRYLHSKNGKRVFHKMITKFPVRLQLLIDSAIEKSIVILGSKKSATYMALDPTPHIIHLKKYFDNLEQYQFEDCCFYGVKDYDGYLKSMYGDDYMTPKQWNHMENYDDVVV